ncbi:hypothetical protein [uncultured Cohaesibacter sp.]|uniref:hypothetical protein n=1 Tax=uncultured Cohaesibacter sp. TaxID=1002546 RepID=UPI002A0A4FB0|nr:hypothetical protein [uncultured Cohaesibacter sp.]
MSSVASSGAAIAYTNAAQSSMDLGSTLIKMAHNADMNMANTLDALVQKGMQNRSSAPEGMGQAVNIKA